jgi:hypothetical protein
MIQTYGITIATITQRATVTINANTRPSATAVEDMITIHAARVNSIARAVGVTATDPTDETYQILRNMIIYGVLAEVFALQDRGAENSTFFRSRVRELEEQLRADPQTVAQPDGPNRSRVFSSALGGEPGELQRIRTGARSLSGIYSRFTTH